MENKRLDHDLYQWNAKTVLEKEGVVVGCSQTQEWLLPWWWMHYSTHNQIPVTFVDFGDMSQEARQWCEKKGKLTSLSFSIEKFIAGKDSVSSEHAKIWKGLELDVWQRRLQWFKKPFACLQSPYKWSLWLDLDCEIRKSLSPLFSFSDNPMKMALAEEPPLVQKFHEQKGLIQFGEIEYNTGVIAFQHGSTIIQDWAKMGIQFNNALRGDQEAYSRMVFLNDLQIPKLDPIYNWRGEFAVDETVAIIHWLGGSKHHIRDEMSLFEKERSVSFSFAN